MDGPRKKPQIQNLASFNCTIIDMSFSPEGNRFVTISEDRGLKLWKMKKNSVELLTIRRIRYPGRVRYLPTLEMYRDFTHKVIYLAKSYGQEEEIDPDKCLEDDKNGRISRKVIHRYAIHQPQYSETVSTSISSPCKYAPECTFRGFGQELRIHQENCIFQSITTEDLLFNSPPLEPVGLSSAVSDSVNMVKQKVKQKILFAEQKAFEFQQSIDKMENQVMLLTNMLEKSHARISSQDSTIEKLNANLVQLQEQNEELDKRIQILEMIVHSYASEPRNQ